jgi:hypothetical protein
VHEGREQEGIDRQDGRPDVTPDAEHHHEASDDVGDARHGNADRGEGNAQALGRCRRLLTLAEVEQQAAHDEHLNEHHACDEEDHIHGPIPLSRVELYSL